MAAWASGRRRLIMARSHWSVSMHGVINHIMSSRKHIETEGAQRPQIIMNGALLARMIAAQAYYGAKCFKEMSSRVDDIHNSNGMAW